MRKARYEVWRGRNGDWYGRLVAPNGRIVLDSGEGYRRQGDLMKMARKYLAIGQSVVITDKPVNKRR